MAEKLKIIALGGLSEIGKNLYVYEFGGDILIVDCGLGFPDDEAYGVDIVIPDFTYLVKNKSRVRAVVLTHGHEDHIGAIPYLLRELNVPIYATPMTAGLVQVKLAEHGLVETMTIQTFNAGESFKVGCFK
ncbi:MAG: ribonuclease J, partial [Clostridiales bacterium]|nr:ribonuclease J [Clostridiales bacterium]